MLRSPRVILPALLLCSMSCGMPPANRNEPFDGDGGGPSDAGSDAGTDGFATCTGACSTANAGITFGASSRSLTRAFFGLTSPGKSDGAVWELYLEASAGGNDACPGPSSPSPDYLLVVSGLSAPLGPATVVPRNATVVDFEGALLPGSVLSHANQSSVSWIAADLCLACAEGAQPDRPSRFVALAFTASFPEGTSKGHLYATHCASLDDL